MIQATHVKLKFGRGMLNFIKQKALTWSSKYKHQIMVRMKSMKERVLVRAAF